MGGAVSAVQNALTREETQKAGWEYIVEQSAYSSARSSSSTGRRKNRQNSKSPLGLEDVHDGSSSSEDEEESKDDEETGGPPEQDYPDDFGPQRRLHYIDVPIGASGALTKRVYEVRERAVERCDLSLEVGFCFSFV